MSAYTVFSYIIMAIKGQLNQFRLFLPCATTAVQTRQMIFLHFSSQVTTKVRLKLIQAQTLY